MNYTQEILDKLNLDGNLQLKRAIRGCSGFTLYQLIEGILDTSSLEECALKFRYSSSVPLKNAISKVLLPLFPHRKNGGFGNGYAKGAAGSWKHELLYCINYKYCSECDTIKPFSDFGINNGKGIHSLRYECNSCHTYNSKLQKLNIVERTPPWANQKKIRQIYNNCPTGYHVDHIIPLRGSSVSGLHIETNLQYLLPEENLIKNNKYITE